MKKADVDVGNRFMFNVGCIHCHHTNMAPSIKCEKCGHILPFYTMNPFVIFNTLPALKLNLDQVDDMYFGFQRQLHPDKLGDVIDEEREWADQHISQINQSYKALKKPILIAKAVILYCKDPSLPLDKFKDSELPTPGAEFLKTVMALQMDASAETVQQMYADILDRLNVAIAELNEPAILNAASELTYIERLRTLK